MNVEIKPDVTNKIGIWKNLTVYQKQFHIKTGQKIQEYLKCIIFLVSCRFSNQTVENSCWTWIAFKSNVRFKWWFLDYVAQV